jgi:signal transduction histidine kinase
MKRFIVTAILIGSAITVCAQNAAITKLKARLHSATTDSARLSVLDSLSMYNMFFNNKMDSTFYYCNESINKAIQQPDKKYLVLAYARLSFYYNNTGQYKESLNTALKGLDLAEQYRVKGYFSALYYDLAWAYGNLGEDSERLKNTLKGISYLNESKDPFFDQALHLYDMAGFTYANSGKLDSARYYYGKSDSVEKTSKERGAKVISDWGWSIYYLYSTRQYQKADSVIADGIKECMRTGHFLLNFFYIFSSSSYLAQNKIPAAIAQAHTAFRLSIPLTDIAAQHEAASLLNACYEKLGKPDSAYRYLKMQDSLDGVMQMHSNAMDIQQFRFDQQLNQKEKIAANEIQAQKSRTRSLVYVFVTGLVFLLVILVIQLRNSKHKRKANEILRQQKETVENTLTELRSAQAQLVQREKMASLGELTAGIAHEIQNPLNFVNNFSEVNNELIEELKDQRTELTDEEQDEMLKDVRENNEKIAFHGKRAEAIVKNMLEHSRKTTGPKEPIAINALCGEYLRLSYQAMRAKDQSFEADLQTDFDESIGKINIISQDIGRVLLNLFNNAFYAVYEKRKIAGESYKPVVSVKTKRSGAYAEIRVTDNGGGISQSIIGKIFQPFFTTKPTGQGTGLGLSLSYDIITKEHNGTIEVQSTEGEGSTFTIRLPIG